MRCKIISRQETLVSEIRRVRRLKLRVHRDKVTYSILRRESLPI